MHTYLSHPQGCPGSHTCPTHKGAQAHIPAPPTRVPRLTYLRLHGGAQAVIHLEAAAHHWEGKQPPQAKELTIVHSEGVVNDHIELMRTTQLVIGLLNKGVSLNLFFLWREGEEVDLPSPHPTILPCHSGRRGTR